MLSGKSRKSFEPHKYPEVGLTEGNFVVVESSSTFTGASLGVVLPPQKWCENGIPVASSHPRMKNVCIIPSREGDKITKATL